MPDVWHNKKEIVTVDQKLIDKLKKSALRSPKKRARFCLHTHDKASVHEMIIAVARGTYVRPHKHVRKTESFHVIEGRFWLFIFDDKGRVIRKFKMGQKGKEKIFLYRCQKNIWHAIMPITPFVVFHEVTPGPFVKNKSSQFPAWAPGEDDLKGIKDFHNRLLKKCRS